MTKSSKNLSGILNFIKYPFLGLFFVSFLILKIIYSIIKYIILAVIYMLYLPIKLLKNLFKSNDKKSLSESITNMEPTKSSKVKYEKISSAQNKKKKISPEQVEFEKEIDNLKKQAQKKFVEEKKAQLREKKKQLKIQKEEERKKRLFKKAREDIRKNETKEEKALRLIEEKEAKKQEKERLKQIKQELKQKVEEKYKQSVINGFNDNKFDNTFTGKIKKVIYNLPIVKRSRLKRDINRDALMIEFNNKLAKKADKKIVYLYKAKNSDGKIVTGKFAAYSKVEVHSFLLSEGYEVYSITTNSLIQILFKENSVTKFKTKDLIFFLTQLSTYIKVGITLVEALKILSRQYKQRRYKDIFRTLIYDLSTGESLSNAMLKQEGTFPRLLINMVKAAELTGELTEALDDMADYYSEVEQTRKQMINAITYPAIVLFVAVSVLTVIMLWVVPKFVDMYVAIDASKIPGITRFIMSLSAFLRADILYLILIIILIIIVFIIMYKYVKQFRKAIQWILMHLPVIKKVIIYNEVSLFTKTFSSLLAHNVYITDSMQILEKMTNNEIYQAIIIDTVSNLAKGDKISKAFKDHWAFPIPAYEMLVTGENTGQLPEMMKKVSLYYQDLHRDIVTKIKTLLEPFLIIFLTVIVGVIVLAVVVPMFNLYQAIQQM